MKLALSTIDVRHKEALNRMLDVTGRTLRTLEIRRVQCVGLESIDPAALFDIKSIFDLCPHVTDLFVGDLNPFEDVEDLLADQLELFLLYGTQLTKIGGFMRCIPFEDFLSEFAECCPNAAIEVDLRHTHYPEMLEILGSQIEVLAIDDDGYEPGVDMPACLSTNCSNLIELTTGLTIATAYFATPRPNLQRLCLKNDESAHELADVGCIADNSGGLCVINLDGLRVERRVLKKLALANKYVEKVNIDVAHSNPDSSRKEYFSSKYMIDLIDGFLDSQFLQWISLAAPGTFMGKIPGVADRCLLLRNRNVAVRMNSVFYQR